MRKLSKQNKITDINSFYRVLVRFASSQMIATALRLISGLLIIRLIEPELYGQFTGVGVYLGFLLIGQGGIINGLSRELPYELGRGNIEFGTEMTSSVFVFTSYFAAKVILEDHRFKDVLKQSIIFVMGQKTFELFQGEELNVQLRESLSAKGLACQVVKEIKKQSILYLPGAKERAFLIGDFFREQGFESFEIDCYRTLAKVRKENKSKLTNLEKKFLIK